MILGGLGDVALSSPPPAWEAVVGVPVASLPPGARTLLMALLATLGSSLVGCGTATIALVNGPLRSGDRWSAPVVLIVVISSEGVNSLTMARLGVPYFWAPLLFTSLVVAGLAVALLPSNVFGRQGSLAESPRGG